MAKRLAYSLMGCTDKSRIEFIQFHQSYSYEDFVEGYRPIENGFELQNGIFFSLCKDAENDPDIKTSIFTRIFFNTEKFIYNRINEYS